MGMRHSPLADAARCVGWVPATLTLLGVAGCSGQMADQPTPRAQEAAPALASESLPVRDLRPWAVLARESLASSSMPLVPPDATRSAALYRDNCGFCHGSEGKGNGPVGEVYTPRPADLTSARLRAYPDGLLYLRFTNGFSTMPAFYWRLDELERWRVVAHVRELQRRSPGP